MFHQKPSKLTEKNSFTAEELKERFSQNADLLVINVLAQEVYVDCHITGSINIPYDRLIETVSSWEKDKEIVLYCAQKNCDKSDMAYELLLDMGFTNLHTFPGGMHEWVSKNYDTSGMCQMRYLHEM